MKFKSFVFGIVSSVMTHFSFISRIKGTSRGGSSDSFNVNLVRVAPHFKVLEYFWPRDVPPVMLKD